MNKTDKVERINGLLFINGYLCNDANQPITVKSGYTEEDEKAAEKAYARAKEIAHYANEEAPYYQTGLTLGNKKPKRRRRVYVAPLEDDNWR